MSREIISKLLPQQLLAAIIEEPNFFQLIQDVSPAILSKLINHIGLEDAGEIVELATTEQLRHIFDEDLWKTGQPGSEETFDADRFALWLTIMLEISPEFAITRIMEMDEDLVTLGLAAHIRVLTFNTVAMYLGDLEDVREADIIKKAMANGQSLVLGEFLVLSTGTKFWHAIAILLAELDYNHHHFLETLFSRIISIATECIEDNGELYPVLSAAETLAVDVSAERDERREQQGFVPRVSALQFLQLAVITPLQEIKDFTTQDPITRMHFRTYKAETDTFPYSAHSDDTSSSTIREREKKLHHFEKWLQAEGALPYPEHHQLSSQKQPRKKDSLFVRAIHTLFIENREIYDHCRVELQYLANVLIAANNGAKPKSRPIGAVKTVITVCSEGIEALLSEENFDDNYRIKQAEELIVSLGAIRLFRIGWHHRHTINEIKISN
jgi:hypothetical protein